MSSGAIQNAVCTNLQSGSRCAAECKYVRYNSQKTDSYWCGDIDSSLEVTFVDPVVFNGFAVRTADDYKLAEFYIAVLHYATTSVESGWNYIKNTEGNDRKVSMAYLNPRGSVRLVTGPT